MFEGVVKFARLKYFVPVPEVADFDELNAFLETRCRENLVRTLRGKTGTKAELLKDDQKAFLPLPATPFDALPVFERPFVAFPQGLDDLTGVEAEDLLYAMGRISGFRREGLTNPDD